MNEDFSCQDFLAHHGILGQKWGVRNYQYPDGSLTPEGRKRYGVGSTSKVQRSIKKKLEARKSEKAKKSAERKELSEEEKAERAAKAKENLKEHLRKHPAELPKYSRQLTKEDAAEIIDNINFDRKLKDVRRQEIRIGMQKIQDVSNDIGTVSNLIGNATRLYNNTADVFNTLADTGVITTEMYLPKVGSSNDLNFRRKTLFKMTPEEVLANKDKFTTEELKAYDKRKSAEEDVYDYTEEGKKAAAEKETSGGGKGNKGKNSKDSVDDTTEILKKSFPDADEETLRKVAEDVNDASNVRSKHEKSSNKKQDNDDNDSGSSQPQKQSTTKTTMEYVDELRKERKQQSETKSKASKNDDEGNEYFTAEELRKLRSYNAKRPSSLADDLRNSDPNLYNKWKKAFDENYKTDMARESNTSTKDSIVSIFGEREDPNGLNGSKYTKMQEFEDDRTGDEYQRFTGPGQEPITIKTYYNDVYEPVKYEIKRGNNTPYEATEGQVDEIRRDLLGW